MSGAAPATYSQQRRLADPRLAAHHQRPPVPGSQIPEETIECRTFPVPVQ
jgi:hypothetical protein